MSIIRNMIMCFRVFAILFTALSLLATTAISAPLNNPSRIYARTGRIDLTLGTKPMNIGHRNINDVHNSVQRALKSACPHSEDGHCGHNVKAKFAVWVLKPQNLEISSEDIYVTVNSARWGNPDIYELLIDAVAGVADRATFPKESCHHFNQKGEGNALVPYRFCSTVDRVVVAFPGGHGMNVTLKGSSYYGGEFNCEKFRVAAERYVQDLQVDIARQVKDEDFLSWLHAGIRVAGFRVDRYLYKEVTWLRGARDVTVL